MNQTILDSGLRQTDRSKVGFYEAIICRLLQKETRDNEAQSSKGNRIEDCQPNYPAKRRVIS